MCEMAVLVSCAKRGMAYKELISVLFRLIGVGGFRISPNANESSTHGVSSLATGVVYSFFFEIKDLLN